MGIFDKLFGRTDSAEAAIRTFEENRKYGSFLGLELKKAYDLQKVGIQGRPQYPPTDIASLFAWSRRNELVYACIEKICQAAQDPEPIVEMKKGDAWERDDSHALRRLLMKPNPLDDWCSYINADMASFHTAGISYAEIVRTPDGLPAQLWPLNPACIRPIAGKGENGSPISGYEYKDGSEKVTLKPSEVLVRRNRTVADKFHGLSPLAVCLGSVDADQAQTDYVRAFFDNSGIPSGLLKFQRRMTREEMEEKRQAWNMRYSRGGQAQRGVAVFDDTVDYQQIGAPLDELESDALRFQVESRICSVFGVPPVLVGAYVGLRWQNNRASAREAQTDFWINKMSPLFKGLRSFLQWNLLTQFVDQEKVFAGDIRLNWDMSTVIALQEDVDAIHTRARENVKAGIWTLNEGRAATGQDEDTDGDYYIRSMTVAPQSAEQAVMIAQRVDQGKPEPEPEDGPLDADEIDDTKTLDEFEEIEQKARALLGAGNGHNGNGAGDDDGRRVITLTPEFVDMLSRKVHLVVREGDGKGKIVNTLPVKYDGDTVTVPPYTFRQLLGIDPPESKVYDLDGLTLSREPNAVESKIDLKAIATATTDGTDRIKGVLLKLRETLIKQAVDMLSDADPAQLHAVVLTPDLKFYNQLRKELDAMYKRGRVLIDQEAGAQTKGRIAWRLLPAPSSDPFVAHLKAATVEDDDDADLDRLSEVTVSRVVNQVQSTAGSILATLATLGVVGDELRSRIRDGMNESSSAYVEGSAGAAANRAMQLGRAAEMEARASEIDRYTYSSIFDINTCDPCGSHDGQESKDLSDLPDTPNPECEGGDKCRCFVLAVWV